MKIRVVLDANIYASALMKSESLPARVLRKIIDDDNYELVLSREIIDELRRILFYPKIRTYIKKADQEILSWLDALNMISHIVVQRYSYEPIVLEDPDDDIYLIAAMESLSRYIVSGDQHLLKMNDFSGIKIITAVDFIHSMA